MSYTLQIRFTREGKNQVHRSKWTWRPSQGDIVDVVRRLRHNQLCEIEVTRVILTQHREIENYQWPATH